MVGMSNNRKAFAKQVTQKMFKEVWDEFYTWEEEYCKQALASLAPTSGASSSGSQTTATNTTPPTVTKVSPVKATNGKQSKQGYQFIEFSGGAFSEKPAVFVRQNPVTYRCRTTGPSPPYEACTYSRKNLYYADDVCDKLPFMPFSDSTDFPAAEYLKYYDRIGWDIPKDPDRQ